MSDIIAALSSMEFNRALILFGFTDQNVYGFIMADNFPKEGKSLVKNGYLSEGAITTKVPDRWNDDPCAWVKVEWNPETRTYGYYCISAMGVEWIDAPEEDLKTYDINLDWMADHIRDLAGIDPSTKVRTIIPNLLWDLGSIRVGNRKATIFLARNLSDHRDFDQVYEALLDWTGKPPGVVLSNNVPTDRRAKLPGGHRILSLKKILMEKAGNSMLDMELLHGTLNSANPSLDVGPVNHNFDFSTVQVHGREFVFTGEKQKIILSILYRAWRVGNPKCQTRSVLAESETSAHALSHIFRNHHDWKELIGYGDGFCWLKV
jgi:hypothetical protein